MNTVDMPASKCPFCGFIGDQATGIGPRPTPSPGDAGICFQCVSLLVYDDKLALRKPTAMELKFLQAQPLVQRCLQAFKEARSEQKQ